MAMKEMEGKNIYVKLVSGRIYTGVVKEVNFLGNGVDDIPYYMFSIVDKFGKLVSFSSKEISFMEEE